MDSELTEYQRLCDVAESYYEAHKQEIKDQEWAEKEREILERYDLLDESLDSNFSVWCRNGSVTSEAAHCDSCLCEHKADKDDVKRGISTCQRFQITTRSNTWGGAVFLYPIPD